MNVATALKQAIDNTRKWSELMDLLDSADKRGMAKHNNMTRAKAYDILRASVEDKHPAVIAQGSVFNKNLNKTVMTGEGMLISNILKEFG
jgi:hypothetical protein